MAEIKIFAEGNTLSGVRKFGLTGSPLEIRDMVTEIMGRNTQFGEAILNAAILYLSRPENKMVREMFINNINR